MRSRSDIADYVRRQETRAIGERSCDDREYGFASDSTNSTLMIRNATESTIRDGYAVATSSIHSATPLVFDVVQPTLDSQLNVFSWRGADLQPGAIGVVEVMPLFRFRRLPSDAVDAITPGSFVGIDGWYASYRQFGLLVLAVNDEEAPDGETYEYIYARYSGILPIVKATDDPSSGTVDVRKVTVSGAETGSEFSARVFP